MITLEWRQVVAQFKKKYDGKDHEDPHWPLDFWKFLIRNQIVYNTALELTRKAAKKRSRFSIHTIWHVIRWYTEIEERPGYEPFKINNDWGPYIGRLIMWDHDEIPNTFFERRILRRSSRTLRQRGMKKMETLTQLPLLGDR